MGADPVFALLATPDPARGTPGLPPSTLYALTERVARLGGTIDTAAQELGVVDETTALDLLGRAWRLPPLGRRDILDLDPTTLGAALPRHLAEDHGLCPVAVRGGLLVVACRAPAHAVAFHATLDELGVALSMTLVARVTTEALLALAWQRVYGRPIPARLQALLGPATGQTDDESGWSATATPRAVVPKASSTATTMATAAGHDGSGWQIPVRGQTVLPAAPHAPPDRAALSLIEDGTVSAAAAAPPDDDAAQTLHLRRQKVLWNEQDCVAALEGCTSRHALLDVILRFTYRRVRTALVFVKQGDALVCFDLLDQTLEPRALQRRALPGHEPHVVARAVSFMAPSLGPVDAADPLCALLGRHPRAVVVAPIVLSGRAIGAVVGANDDTPIPPQLLGELQRVLPVLQQALARLIHQARTQPPMTSSPPVPVTSTPRPVLLPPVPPRPAAPPTTTPPVTMPPTTTTPSSFSASTTSLPAVAPSPGAAARESLLQATWRSWLHTPVDDSVMTLVQTLDAGDAGGRAAAARLLALGLAAMPALARAFPGPLLDDGDPDGAVFLQGPLAATLLRLPVDLLAPLVVGALDDPDPRRRFGATALALALRLPASVPGLGRRVLDTEPRIVTAALHALLALRDAPGTDLVRTRLRDLCRRGHDHERLLAIRAVAALRDDGAIDTLIDLVGARPRELADEAVHALVELTREDFGTAERRWRAWYTTHRDEPRRRWLLLALQHRDRALRAAAADELADDGVSLMGYLPDAAPGERHEALVRICASLREPMPS